MRTSYAGLVSEKLMGQTVTLMGWAHRRRDHGGVIFIDLRDREGLVQVVCDPDRAQTFATAEGVRDEFCLKVTGVVRARPAGTENANLTSGKVEVLARTLEVLNPSVTPPFQIDDDTRRRLLEGLDDIAVTLGHQAEIDAYEADRPAYKPTTLPARTAG